MKYFICGFSGSGKSTLLKKLSKDPAYEGYHFVDLDDFILSQNAECGRLGDLIESKGWDWFRKTEKQTLLELLKSPNIWIALGGGTLDDELAEELKGREDVKGIWLHADFELCWDRIQNDANRPLVKKGRNHLKWMFDERLKLYSQFERLIIDEKFD